MRKNTRFTCQMLLVLGLLSIIPAGCGSSYIDIFPAKQALDYPLIGTSDISTLDPALVPDAAWTQAIELVYSGLVSLDPRTLSVIPDIATGWDVSNDGRTYAFHLRHGVKFSNGDPVDASTFAYSIDRALDPATGSTLALRYLGHIVGAADRHAGKSPTLIGTGLLVVDPLTLQIDLDAPISFFLQALTASPSWAVDKKVAQQYSATAVDGQVVGTGPFMLKSWQHGVDLTFDQNPNWYGKKLTLTEVRLSLFPDTSTAFNHFEGKEIDVDPSVDSEDYPTAQAMKHQPVLQGPALTIRYLAPNSAQAPFDNLAVRQAFAEAVDREMLAHQVLQDSVTPSGHIVPQGMPGYFAGLQGLPFNPQEARAKLISVYPDVRAMPSVTLEYAKGADDEKVAAKLQQDFLTYLGVSIKLDAVDATQFQADVSTHQVQFALLSWTAEYADPQVWLSLQVAKRAPDNTVKYPLLKQEACGQTPPQSRVPGEARGFGFTV